MKNNIFGRATSVIELESCKLKRSISLKSADNRLSKNNQDIQFLPTNPASNLLSIDIKQEKRTNYYILLVITMNLNPLSETEKKNLLQLLQIIHTPEFKKKSSDSDLRELIAYINNKIFFLYQGNGDPYHLSKYKHDEYTDMLISKSKNTKLKFNPPEINLPTTINFSFEITNKKITKNYKQNILDIFILFNKALKIDELIPAIEDLASHNFSVTELINKHLGKEFKNSDHGILIS